MPVYDSKQGEDTRFVHDLPRVDIGRPDDWPTGFVPPDVIERPAGMLIGGRPQVRRSWLCPGCRRGGRSLWLDEGRWVCWRCAKLVRPTEWQSIATRRARRARAIRRRLGGDGALYGPVPTPQQAGMALSTDPTRGLLEYDRLVEELRQCEIESLAWPNVSITRFRGR